jgi:nitrite reductase/ring-hydroxylating ferredoxin subunit
MVTQLENDRMTLVEGEAPMGRLMRENYWVPFALSAHLDYRLGPTPVRLFGQNYVAFRSEDGRVGFMDERCPHRRASLLLAHNEGNGIRCIYHGWKIDVSGCVAEAPTQVVRPERFAANVDVSHFPVHESGGIAWAWMGGGEPPPFPDLPFAVSNTTYSWMTVSQMGCNWLQGLEGSIDSAHVGMLHQTWHRVTADMPDHANLGLALDAPPKYQTETTSYGLQAAALRATVDGKTYVRVTEHLMPFVTVVSVGRSKPRDGAVFVISPVDDTHHLLFFGAYGDTPMPPPEDQPGFVAPGVVPDPHNYAGSRGDRSNRWGQDRTLLEAGHFTGFGRNLLEEDAAVQTSMGPIVDRTKENLSSSDAAVAHLRRMLLEALTAAEAGELPPGSSRTAGVVRLPNAAEGLVDDEDCWAELTTSLTG